VSKDIGSKEDHENELLSDIVEKKRELSDIESSLRDLSEKIAHKGEDEQIRIKKEIEQIRGDISRSVDSIELLEHEIQDIKKERQRLFIEIDTGNNLLSEVEEKISDEHLRKESVGWMRCGRR